MMYGMSCMYFLNCYEKWRLSNIHDSRDVQFFLCIKQSSSDIEPKILPTCDLHILAHWWKLAYSTNKTGNLEKCMNSRDDIYHKLFQSVRNQTAIIFICVIT